MAGLSSIVDTSVLIDLERHHRKDARSILNRLSGSAGVGVITIAELYSGVHRARNPEQRAFAELFIEDTLAELSLLPFGMAEAVEYSRLGEVLRQRGLTVGAHDLQIAATAMVAGADVITRNVREFAQIPGLAVRVLELDPPR